MKKIFGLMVSFLAFVGTLAQAAIGVSVQLPASEACKDENLVKTIRLLTVRQRGLEVMDKDLPSEIDELKSAVTDSEIYAYTSTALGVAGGATVGLFGGALAGYPAAIIASLLAPSSFGFSTAFAAGISTEFIFIVVGTTAGAASSTTAAIITNQYGQTVIDHLETSIEKLNQMGEQKGVKIVDTAELLNEAEVINRKISLIDRFISENAQEARNRFGKNRKWYLFGNDDLKYTKITLAEIQAKHDLYDKSMQVVSALIASSTQICPALGQNSSQ